MGVRQAVQGSSCPRVRLLGSGRRVQQECAVGSNSRSPPGSSVQSFSIKNTGVGCHFLLQGIFPTQGSNLCIWSLLQWQADSLPLSHLGESESRSVLSDSLRPHGLYSPWNSPGQNTGVGSLSLLQGIFPTQGLNPGLLHCRQILYQLSHKGSPRILECVAYAFSSGSS